MLACATASVSRGPRPPATLDKPIVSESPQISDRKDSQRKTLKLTIEPVDYGPRFSERLRPAISPVTSNEVAGAIIAEKLRIEDCYRWAYAGRNIPRGSLAFHMRFSADGVVSSLATTARITDGHRLVKCAEDVLADAWLRRPSNRQVDTSFEVAFDPSGYMVPSEPVVRPKRHTNNPSKNASDAGKAAIDTVALSRPVMTIKAAVPQIRIGSSSQGSHYNTRLVFRSLRHNLGAYRACALSAAKRGAIAAETVELVGSLDDFGTVTSALDTENPKNQELARCLQAALAEVWFPLLRRGVHPAKSKPPIQFRVAFKLLPDPSGAPLTAPRDTLDRESRESYAANLLRRGDGHRAYRVYSDLLKGSANDGRECFWHAGAVNAVILIAPWYDSRVFGVLQKMEEYIEGLANTSGTSACVDTAAVAVRDLALLMHSTAAKLGRQADLSDVVSLYDWLLKVQPKGQTACEYLYYKAEALWQLAEYEAEATRAEGLWKAAEIARQSVCPAKE